MDYLSKLKSIFNVSDIIFNERMKIVEMNFEIRDVELPIFDSIKEFIMEIPSRDKVVLILTDDSDEHFMFSRNDLLNQEQYIEFCQNAQLGEFVAITVSIEKEVFNNRFSIYDFKSFTVDVLSLSVEQLMAAFSLLFQNSNQLYFEVFSQECFFATKTMTFLSDGKDIILSPFNRDKRVQDCKDSSFFYNLTDYPLLPDDFMIEIDFINNPLTELFGRLSTILSLIYISSSGTIDSGQTKVQIAGQRNVDFIYKNEEIKSNPELYKIYHWIYTDGNAIDKAILARNIISLHCKYSELIDIDGKTLASIQSNFNLYLKSNVVQYLELKNKLAEFICDVVSKTGDYATTLLDRFKSNLIAVFGFLFTVILANIVSDQPLDNIFTHDITIILEAVLLGSAVYLTICILESDYQMKKAKDSYSKLKHNYKSILTESDIEEIFDNDKLINDMLGTVKKWKILYIILWIVFIVGSLIAIEMVSTDPVIIDKLAAIISH
ncbi:hypothetical protein [[Clostridium] fimetarium]|uniref:Uncharacterized protein n=1 Tax=[Clostridium] fimetarium TaxID=99656 RepID=A0A1I0M9A9_9FIRM|nr:hypothetical protein [[Clostridium] fimetarium]SEV84933.1 hypothetical protein SAMN05421659_101318 [[Clostridium] fimetarium]